MEADYSSIGFRQFRPVDTTDMYLAFQDAFSDYPFPLKMTLHEFRYKFINRMQLTFEKSFGAWEDDRLVAFIFARVYRDTIYYGAMGVRKDYRGRSLLQELFAFQEKVLLQSGVRKCLLEVLLTNKKAQEIYTKLGFAMTRKLISYRGRLADASDENSHETFQLLDSIPWQEIDEWLSFYPAFMDSRAVLVPGKIRDIVYCTRDAHGLAGILVGDPQNGRISLLVIRPDRRRSGLASALLKDFQGRTKTEILYLLNVPEVAVEMQSFLAKYGFVQLIEQAEMQKIL